MMTLVIQTEKDKNTNRNKTVYYVRDDSTGKFLFHSVKRKDAFSFIQKLKQPMK